MEKEKMMVLFREMVAEKFLDSELNLKLPRSSLMDLIVAFREKYVVDILSVCDYSDLAETFAECASIYTAQSMFRFDRKKNKFYIASSSKYTTPAMMDGARCADYRHHQVLGGDY